MRDAITDKAFGSKTVVYPYLLEARGWTTALIKKYLGDFNLGNNSSSTAPRIYLNELMAIEATDAFKIDFERSCKRRKVPQEVLAKYTAARQETEVTKELFDLKSVKKRLKAVAQDLQSGTLRFSVIDPWTLGELLGLDWEDTGEWCSTCLAYRREFDGEEFEFPYAENIKFLKKLVPAERYEELRAQSSRILAGEEGKDLSLTDQEVTLLREAYIQKVADQNGSDLIHVQTSLEVSDTFSLGFGCLIGDGGDISDAWGPYEELRGEAFDESDYIVVL